MAPTRFRRCFVCLLMVSCGDGGERAIAPTLRFDLQEDAAIERLARGSIGGDADHAAQLFEEIQGYAPDFLCPFIEEIDGDLTLSGSCNAFLGGSSYYYVDGFARASNPPDAAVRYDFDAFSVVGFSDDDGLYAGFVENGAGGSSIDLTVDHFNFVIRSLLSTSCRDGRCRVQGGVVLAGAGGALVSADIEVEAGVPLLRGTGTWTLEGADTLQIAVDHGCASWRTASDRRGLFADGTASCF